MHKEHKSATCIIDNLYAFLGWVVSYSDYGKEVTVDAMLKKFKLIDKIDENMTFESQRQYDEFNKLVKECLSDRTKDYITLEINEDENRRCRELEMAFTPRFKRAKQFTIEQIAEYKSRKIMNKEGTIIINEEMNPVKVIDHEAKKVVCVFYSTESASRVLEANNNRIKEAASESTFYKGFIWMYTDKNTYEMYNEKIYSYGKCRKKSKSACKINENDVY